MMTKTTLTPTLRANLKKYREARGWTQLQAAKEIGVDKQTYHFWESGKSRGMQAGRLHTIAETFGVAPETLTEPPTPKKSTVVPTETYTALEEALNGLVTNWPTRTKEEHQ